MYPLFLAANLESKRVKNMLMKLGESQKNVSKIKRVFHIIVQVPSLK